MKLFLDLRDAKEELFKVPGRRWRDQDDQAVVVDLLVCNVVRSAHALDVVAARLLNIFTEIAIQILNLLDFQVNAQRPANVDAEAPQQGFPEGVFLDSLVAHGRPKDLVAQLLKAAHPLLTTAGEIRGDFFAR